MVDSSGWRGILIHPDFWHLEECSISTHRASWSVMAVRECAFLGADPAVRTRQGNAAERERAETVGPRPAHQLHVPISPLSQRGQPDT